MFKLNIYSPRYEINFSSSIDFVLSSYTFAIINFAWGGDEILTQKTFLISLWQRCLCWKRFLFLSIHYIQPYLVYLIVDNNYMSLFKWPYDCYQLQISNAKTHKLPLCKKWNLFQILFIEMNIIFDFNFLNVTKIS